MGRKKRVPTWAEIGESLHTIGSLASDLHKLRGQLEDEIEEINRKIESDDVDVLIECREMIPQAEWEEFQRWRHMRLMRARQRIHSEESRRSE